MIINGQQKSQILGKLENFDYDLNVLHVQYSSSIISVCVHSYNSRYGNAVNVKRTVFGYARAGMGGIMIEDQVSPKRCGHVAGKSVVSFDEAVQRVKAACDAR